MRKQYICINVSLLLRYYVIKRLVKQLIYFEISGDHFSLIGSQQCD